MKVIKMNKPLATSLIASFLTLTVIVSTPAVAAPTSIVNGDFESGEDLDTTIDGWNTLNQRIDLGTTSIAGCVSVDTSDYTNFNEWFAESGKSYFNYFEEDTDGTYDYDIFIYDNVEITAATVNGAGTQLTYTVTNNNDYDTGDYVRVLWNEDPSFAVTGAQVVSASVSTFTVAGDFEPSATSSDGGVANRFVTALGFPFGHRSDDTAYLETSPGVRVLEHNWTSAQRAAVTALVRDPVVANDSLTFPFSSAPEFSIQLEAGDANKSVSFFSEMEGDDSNGNIGAQGYALHGPALVSDEFTAKTVDDLSFRWEASGDRDDYKVFGYLLKTSDCSQTEVLDSTGESQPWEAVTVAIPANGTYRFVFVSGTYDQNWGSGGGAVMSLDDVILSPNAERVAAAEAAATPPSLAKTGSDFQWLVVAGLTAVAVGSGFLVASRRKRTA